MDDVNTSKCYVSDMCMQCKVEKESKVWNRYNQVPDLTQDTLWESDKYTKTLDIGEPRSQQVTTMLHDTDKTIMQRQTHKKRSTKEIPPWNGQ